MFGFVSDPNPCALEQTKLISRVDLYGYEGGKDQCPGKGKYEKSGLSLTLVIAAKR